MYNLSNVEGDNVEHSSMAFRAPRTQHRQTAAHHHRHGHRDSALWQRQIEGVLVGEVRERLLDGEKRHRIGSMDLTYPGFAR